ncbi:xin actin-binding repeat-containing protein 1-like [Narcine bancroftii]|uniref:xin actin-binding repeat-containing protein 1-like n=1 Tax=Narcine bancroftii TaxID=1343680 RepID=UPI003831E164
MSQQIAIAQNLDRSQPSDTSRTPEDVFLPPPPPDLLEASTEPKILTENQPQRIPPPPHQTFVKLQQQRQINELKRLYKHMHPELRKHLQEVVTEDWAEVLDAERTAAALATGSQGNSEAVLQTEVQSMRWIFDNWPLDTIGDHQATKKMTEEEAILSGDVQSTSRKFENQTLNEISSQYSEYSYNSSIRKEQTKGDVRTALWLFETQPMDSLNKIYSKENDLQEAVLKEPVQKGDVRGTKLLFETHPLCDLGRSNSMEESSLLQLRSEVQELKGDVNRTIKLFETEPLCAIRDTVGNIHQIKSICREEIQQSESVQSTRWLFETQPLGSINKNLADVKIIRGISLEETQQSGCVGKKRWLFETQALDALNEQSEDAGSTVNIRVIEGGDVNKKCWLFETQPLDSLKESHPEEVAKEQVTGVNVHSSLWLFETQPMEILKDSFEVGHLKRVMTEEERGDVKNKAHLFESCSLDNINKGHGEASCSTGKTEMQKGDVETYKHLFETLPLDGIKNSDEISTENHVEILAGNVNEIRALFETVPLYAIMDGAGHCHQVKTVSREQVVRGDIKHYRWMFETRRLDQFGEGTQNVELVKGITKEEIQANDMKTTRWLFETQPLDVIHANVNKTEIQTSEKEDILKGDVKKCRWLFETQPMDALYERAEDKQDCEVQQKGAVKSYTWIFETQPMDSINENEERHLKVCSRQMDDIIGADVKTKKHLFETEQCGNIGGELDETQNMRYTSEVDVQSGNVSRVKEIYQSNSLNEIADVEEKRKSFTSTQVDAMQPEAGCVHKFTWLFENCPIGSIKEMPEEVTPMNTITDVKGGDVGGKRFVFETYSLDQIKEETQVKNFTSRKEESVKGDVKSCTMLFETQPLYALRDKEGQYHEVTTAKKEEIMRGDVRGTRWLFETKPLDTIKPLDEVFVIRAVTQEDVQAGDVTAARWKFETQPLDSIRDEAGPGVKMVDEVQGGDVQASKQLFEGQQGSQRYVRMVSVSDVQRGDVRTSTWLFENQPIDSLKGERAESAGVTTVQREDVQKGDVKRCTWLFESQPLDSLKNSDSSIGKETKEEVACTDVKTTTWLFETTPLDTFIHTQGNTESANVKKQSIHTSLEILINCGAIKSRGLIIESSEKGILKMAKYQLTTQNDPHVVKEEVIGGNLQRILMQLLQRKESLHSEGIVLKEDESGRISTRTIQLFSQSKVNINEECVKEDSTCAIYSFLMEVSEIKQGILIQETEKGIVQITIYSLINHPQNGDEKETIKGDVKSTINSLLASTQQQATSTVKRDEKERGNVQLYTTCIESGTLDCLKDNQEDSDDPVVSTQREEIVRGDVEGAIRNLTESRGQIEKSVDDIIPGDVKGTKKYFLTEAQRGQGITQKDGGDISPAYQSLGQAVNVGVKKDTLPGDVKAKPENAKYQTRKLDKEDALCGNTKDTLTVLQEHTFDPKEASLRESAESSFCSFGKSSSSVSDIEAANAKGQDLQAAMQNLREVTAEANNIQQKSSMQEHFRSHAQSTASTQQHHHQSTQRNKTLKKELKKTTQISSQQQSSADSRHQASARVTVTQYQQPKTQQSIHQVSASEGTQGLQAFMASPNESQRCGHFTGIVQESGDKMRAAPDQVQVHGQHLSTNLEKENQAVADQVIVKGDVNSTPKALKDSVTEQESVEKEEVVRGNLQAALQSLGKANMNISKGDFKAAMIYRTAGQSHSCNQRKSGVRTVDNQISQPQSDAEFPSPVPVTRSSAPSIEACGHQPAEGTPSRLNQPSSSTVRKPPPSQFPPLLPPKMQERNISSKPSIAPRPQAIPARHLPTESGKPALPPKPEHLQAIYSVPSPPIPPRNYASLMSKSSPLSPAGCKLCRVKLIRGSLPAETTNLSAYQNMQLERKHEQLSLEEKSTTIASYTKGMKTPLQLAEEKYKQGKEELSQLNAVVINPTPDTSSDQGHQRRTSFSDSPSDTSDSMMRQPEMLAHKMNATEVVQGSMRSYSKESSARTEVGQESKSVLQTFNAQNKSNSPQISQPNKRELPLSDSEDRLTLPKKVKTMSPKTSDRITAPNSYQQPQSSPESHYQQPVKTPFEQAECQTAQYHKFASQHGLDANDCQGLLDKGQLGTPESDAVLMRGDRQQCKETEDDRRKRLSVHKEEIMQGNVKAAMEIFENLKKREELQQILTRVKEFEEETFKVDVKGLKSLFENVPEWVVSKNNVVKQLKPIDSRKDEMQNQPRVVQGEVESLSSVELVFEDLERASAEIIYLKEQTLAKLLHIEESIKKALYSVSNLKSESDIAGLSGLFGESLGASSNSPSGNIKKISLVSSKSNLEKAKQLKESQIHKEWTEMSEKQAQPSLEIPSLSTRVNSPSSPSYISIESAVRKPADPLNKNVSGPQLEVEHISPSPQNQVVIPCSSKVKPFDDSEDSIVCNGCKNADKPTEAEKQHSVPRKEFVQRDMNNEFIQTNRKESNVVNARDKRTNSPSGCISLSGFKSNVADRTQSPIPQRTKSVVEFKTGPDGGEIVGTKTIMEKYEEIDCFGNKIITSKTSTTVTKQSESTTSSTYEVVQAPPRYDVATSPLLNRHLQSQAGPAEDSLQNSKDNGVVFLSFGNSNSAKRS